MYSLHSIEFLMHYSRLACVIASVTFFLGSGLVWWTNRSVATSENLRVAVWVVDPMENVFRTAQPPPDAPDKIELHAVRNEFECAQIVLRSEERIDELSVQFASLTSSVGRIEASNLRWNVVGYVPVQKNTPKTPASELAGIAPGEFPDPLLEKASFALAPGRSQPLYLTFRVPVDTPPGEYRGAVQITAGETNADTAVAEVPILLTVHGAALSEERHFGFTSWFSAGDLAKQHGVTVWSEDFWRLLPAYARNLNEHRQTMILTPMELIKVNRAANGYLTFDFSRFDRWARLFVDAGVPVLEGKEMGRRVGKWTSPLMEFHPVPVNDPLKATRKPLPNDAVLRAFFGALEQRLEKQGWLDRFVMHVSDEPTRYNYPSWRKMSQFIRAAAPRLRRIEANQTTELDGDIEISVPQLDSFGVGMDRYSAKRNQYGNELWFYTCMYPTGAFANRFVDYPLIKTRLLPWIAARYGLTGYLHWGYNYWSERPFEFVERSNLPPGDSFVVYPGKNGPLNSLRWEMFREGIEDYECLLLLSQKQQTHTTRTQPPSASPLPPLVHQPSEEVAQYMRAIAARMVYAPDQYNLSHQDFNALHRQIRQMLAARTNG
ncbi:MAG: hypothetical protein COS85_24560 [Armatimonadetes bacterium CG07_land_8_20_14_0_80_59_28]|nr:MAG: hypothetical protein COS85_24560 [Armatimonadetes bacterium CG07_land_8_20_14_0_80_59_28]PIY49230.1 MAG: hypothetical protein COZ05_00865 [Armatimonadetes bacterium CG_4_10_14_3_um_filter_59_10]